VIKLVLRRNTTKKAMLIIRYDKASQSINVLLFLKKKRMKAAIRLKNTQNKDARFGADSFKNINGGWLRLLTSIPAYHVHH
jgi:hypothetical protein